MSLNYLPTSSRSHALVSIVSECVRACVGSTRAGPCLGGRAWAVTGGRGGGHTPPPLPWNSTKPCETVPVNRTHHHHIPTIRRRAGCKKWIVACFTSVASGGMAVIMAEKLNLSFPLR